MSGSSKATMEVLTASTSTTPAPGLNVTIIAIVTSAVIVTLLTIVFIVICCSEAITRYCDRKRKIAIEKVYYVKHIAGVY